MRALVALGPGGPDDLRVADVPELEPRPDRVLIDVRSAGVAFADTLIVRGRYQVRPDYPFTPGFEVAGVVLAAPEHATIGPGDEVIAYTGTGAHAQRALAEPRFVLRKPPQLDWRHAAAFMGNSHTAYYALVHRGHLRPGDVVLVHGAAGGVGLAAIQIATALGAEAIALVSSEARAAVAREAGARTALVRDDDWPAQVRRHAGARGVDLVVDPVGGDRTLPSLGLLRRGGRLLVIGFAAGAVPKLPLQRVLNADADVVGVAWTWAAMDEPDLTARMQTALMPLLEQGFLRPLIGDTYTLDDAPAAFRALEDRAVLGKLVLDLAA